MYRQQIAKKNTSSLASTPKTQKTRPTPSYGSLSGTIQRATAKPETLRREEWQKLDGAVGTRATKEMQSGKRTSYVPEFKGISSQLLGESVGKEAPIQAKLTIGAAGDKYEKEADRVAAEVVQEIHTPAPLSNTQGEVVQGKSRKEEESELQRKPMVQRRADAGGEASADLTSAINSARGGGQPLDAGLQKSMGEAMGADFSGVRVHTDVRSDEMNKSIGAKAFTTGQDVFFRQGSYQPGCIGGKELIAHELTHVMQQRGGTDRIKSVGSNITIMRAGHAAVKKKRTLGKVQGGGTKSARIDNSRRGLRGLIIEKSRMEKLNGKNNLTMTLANETGLSVSVHLQSAGLGGVHAKSEGVAISHTEKIWKAFWQKNRARLLNAIAKKVNWKGEDSTITDKPVIGVESTYKACKDCGKIPLEEMGMQEDRRMFFGSEYEHGNPNVKESKAQVKKRYESLTKKSMEDDDLPNLRRSDSFDIWMDTEQFRGRSIEDLTQSQIDKSLTAYNKKKN